MLQLDRIVRAAALVLKASPRVFVDVYRAIGEVEQPRPPVVPPEVPEQPPAPAREARAQRVAELERNRRLVLSSMLGVGECELPVELAETRIGDAWLRHAAARGASPQFVLVRLDVEAGRDQALADMCELVGACMPAGWGCDAG